MNINPPCNKFIIFSGGGGVVFRSESIELSSGKTELDVADVPASFDPNTTTVELQDCNDLCSVVQIDLRRPDKRIMDMLINREKTASDSIIQSATDLKGTNREKIIQICESAYYRRYEDMKGSIKITLEAREKCRCKLELKYFIEDSRIKWKPTIQTLIDEKTKTATIQGYIMVMNNSDFNFDNVELQFAEFDLIKDIDETGFLADIEFEQSKQTAIPSTKLVKNLKKMKTFIK